jgi:hypothetical protein
MSVTAVKDLVHPEFAPEVKKMCTTLSKFSDIGLLDEHFNG